MTVSTVRPRLEAREGTDLRVTTDARLYTDRPFEVTLPGGAYRRITLIARTPSWRDPPPDPAEDVDVFVVDELLADDPRLAASPVRLSWALPWPYWGGFGESEARGARRKESPATAPRCYQLQVEDEAGHVSRLDLSFEEEPSR